MCVRVLFLYVLIDFDLNYFWINYDFYFSKYSLLYNHAIQKDVFVHWRRWPLYVFPSPTSHGVNTRGAACLKRNFIILWFIYGIGCSSDGVCGEITATDKKEKTSYLFTSFWTKSATDYCGILTCCLSASFWLTTLAPPYSAAAASSNFVRVVIKNAGQLLFSFSLRTSNGFALWLLLMTNSRPLLLENRWKTIPVRKYGLTVQVTGA